jgi:hypothetical protein
MFKTGFKSFACVGDSITCEVDHFTITARLFRDDCGDAPDDRQDGFWPSANPDDAGYIGTSDKQALKKARERAQYVFDKWSEGDWFYVGVSVTVEAEGVSIIGEYGHALWGVECNYPGSDNSYLTEVANELLPEALCEAKRKLTRLNILVHQAKREARA